MALFDILEIPNIDKFLFLLYRRWILGGQRLRPIGGARMNKKWMGLGHYNYHVLFLDMLVHWGAEVCSIGSFVWFLARFVA